MEERLFDEGMEDFVKDYLKQESVNETIDKQVFEEVELSDIDEDIEDSTALTEADVYVVRKMDKDQGEDVAVELGRFDKADLANKKAADEDGAWVDKEEE